MSCENDEVRSKGFGSVCKGYLYRLTVEFSWVRRGEKDNGVTLKKVLLCIECCWSRIPTGSVLHSSRIINTLCYSKFIVLQC